MSTSSLSHLLRSFSQLSLGSSLSRSVHSNSKIKIKYPVKKYTIKPLPAIKTGGRREDGRIGTHGIGGGHKQRFRMIDNIRKGPETGSPLVERVLYVRYDPCRSADIALVGSDQHPRYILATQNMKKGDLIKTYGELTRIAVRAEEGNAHPVGSLPIGTLVHNIEKYEGLGGIVARAAGTSGQIIRKIGDRVVIRMPSKREMSVSQKCMAVVGRVSNIDYGKQHIGSAARARWLGKRPDSGLKKKKTGYNGRKIKPIKKLVSYKKPPPPTGDIYKYSF